MIRCKAKYLGAILLAVLFPGSPAPAASREQVASLAQALQPFLAALKGQDHSFACELRITGLPDPLGPALEIRWQRFDEQSFRLVVEHPQYAFELDRSAERTVLLLPRQHVALVGEGAVGGLDTLGPDQALHRLISSESALNTYRVMLDYLPSRLLVSALVRLAALDTTDAKTWTTSRLHNMRLQLADDAVVLSFGKIAATLKMSSPAATQPAQASIPAQDKIEKLDRREMERLIGSALRRATELLAPAADLAAPAQRNQVVPHGTLSWVQGQRLVLLSGTPQQIGTAHGLLLAQQIRRGVDSTLYVVGAVHTLQTGRWFPDEMRQAQAQLSPHIPADQAAELDAMADAAQCSREEVRCSNTFAELFHCSGFAVFGRASAGGKLYHGRVLDYLGQIGLQDCAATFVIAPRGKHAFLSVGYAGLVGCLSGMNEQQISVGAMSGRAGARWDGVPMASLMRQALEECASLDQVEKLWKNSPRTCEYDYIFADGKIPGAVAVAATPDTIDFIRAGQADARFGGGIPDALVIGADDRLATLHQRILDHYAKIDAPTACGLMSPPVAMDSNLHVVLFVPQDLLCYVAQSQGRTIAPGNPYVKYDLRELLQQIAAQKD